MCINNFSKSTFLFCDAQFFILQAINATDLFNWSFSTTFKHRPARHYVMIALTGSALSVSLSSLRSWISHKFNSSSLEHSRESTSWTLRDGSSLGKPPRLGLDEDGPVFPTPTRGFFGFLASPTSRNSKNRLTRLGPNQDSDPFLRLSGTSKMVSRRLKDKSVDGIRAETNHYFSNWLF